MTDLTQLGEVSAQDLNFDLGYLLWDNVGYTAIEFDETYFSLEFA
jgi:hypothetical protein